MDIRYPQEEIETERLALQRLDVHMAPTIFATVDSDRERLNRFLPWVEWMKSGADEMKYIEYSRKGWKAGEVFDYAIFRARDHRYLGNCGAYRMSWKDHRVEFGYWLVGEAEGQGYVTEAVKAMEKEFFGLGFNRIEIRCDPNNIRSAAIPKKLGYTLEGILRQNICINGHYRDTSVYAKLVDDLALL